MTSQRCGNVFRIVHQVVQSINTVQIILDFEPASNIDSATSNDRSFDMLAILDASLASLTHQLNRLEQNRLELESMPFAEGNPTTNYTVDLTTPPTTYTIRRLEQPMKRQVTKKDASSRARPDTVYKSLLKTQKIETAELPTGEGDRLRCTESSTNLDGSG